MGQCKGRKKIQASLTILLLAAFSGAGCDVSGTQDNNVFGFREEVEPEEGGVYVSQLENPLVWGWTEADDLTFERLEPASDQIARQRYSSETGEAIVVSGDQPVFSGNSLGYVGLVSSATIESMEEDSDRELRFFELPSLSLPSDHSPVTLELSRRFGQDHLSPNPVLETIQMRLSDDVIVLPVHVHNFTALDGTPALNGLTERMVFDWFDPGRVVTDSVASYYDSVPGVDRVYSQVTQGMLRAPRYIQPDQVWDAAGIQFHLESFENVPQDLGLEGRTPATGLQNLSEAAAAFGTICGSQPTRIRDFVEADIDATPGIHIYLGGRLESNELLTDLNGVACKPFSTALCNASLGGNKFVAIDIGLAGYGPNVIGHELGHMLGLDHTWLPSDCGDELGPFGVDPDENIMVPGEGTNLTEAQIERARTYACLWLNRWGISQPACS